VPVDHARWRDHRATASGTQRQRRCSRTHYRTRRSRILGTRYVAGYGPCDAADLAKWSSLPITQARRALDAARTQPDADAWPIDDPPPCLLLAAFDTLMLGHRTREPFVAAEPDRHILKGGGMLKPIALTDGVATGTWSIEKGRPEAAWFDQPANAAALAREAADVRCLLAR
jgi:Winged helix DNA-binding domain